MTRTLIWILPIIIIISGCGSSESSNGGIAFNPADVPKQLNWTPPTLNTDGSLFTDLSKYRLYYGPNEGSLKAVFDIDSAGVAITSYTLTTADQNTLASFLSGNATHVFALTTINSQNIESSFSNIVIYL